MVTIFQLIEEKCLVYGERIFLEEFFSGKSKTYSAFYKDLCATVSFLDEQKIPTGIHFSIIAPNSIDYLLVLFAMQTRGNTAVNLNPQLTTKEIAHRLAFTQVEVLITTKEIFLSLQSAINISIVLFLNECPEGDFPNSTHLQLKIPAFSEIPAVENMSVPNAFLQFTGGTSGITKAAIIQHQNVLSNVKQITTHINDTSEVYPHCILVAFPFYHVFSIVFNVLTFLNGGGTCVLIASPRDIDSIIHVFKNYPITFTVAVNTLYKLLMQHPQIGEVDFSSLKYSIGGGEHIQYSTKVKWQALTGVPIYEAYGLTETAAMAIVNPLNEKNDLKTIGIALPETEVELFDDMHQIIRTTDCAGEIALKGPQVTSGYYNNPTETDNAFFEGWFKTGDIAIRNDTGYFTIIDRKKDMISVSGNKVYPNEVEEVIAQVEGILDVAVVARRSSTSGEEVVACVVTDREIDKEQIIAYCRASLTNFKIPKDVVYLAQLPKSPIGKTLRAQLRVMINQKMNGND